MPDQSASMRADSRIPDKEERLERYIAKLDELKNSKLVREFVEREMLLEIIRVNKKRIREFPSLDIQQNAITSLICVRAADLPINGHIKKVTTEIIHLLNIYAKAVKADDRRSSDDIVPRIVNAEALIIKCVQGVVYAISIIMDNLEEALISYFGEEAIPVYSRCIETLEFGEPFLKEIVATFISANIEKAYRELVSANKYSLLREGGFLVISFQLDDVLSIFNRPDKAIEKTEMQKIMGKVSSSKDLRLIHKNVFEYVSSLSLPIRNISKDERVFSSSIVCLDPCGMKLSDEWGHGIAPEETAGRPEKGRSSNDMEEDEIRLALEDESGLGFLKQQVLSLASGAAMALLTIKADYLRTIKELGQKDVELIGRIIRTFELPSIKIAVYNMLESRFMYLLQQKGEEEGGKLIYRVQKYRRTSKKAIAALEKHDLSTASLARLWDDDQSTPGMAVFKNKNLNELGDMMNSLQLSEGTKLKILALWEHASLKSLCQVCINVDRLSKTTTNVKARLTEIMKKFSLGESLTA